MNRREAIKATAAVVAIAAVGIEPKRWRVFELNDCDYYVARSIEEAMATAAGDWGCKPDELEELGLIEDAHELSDEALEILQFVDSDEDDRPIRASMRTFRTELEQRIAAGLSAPEFFAGTGW